MKSVTASLRSSATNARFSRRALLAHLGVGAGILPLLHAERAIGATASGFPKRLITIAWTNGVAQPNFFPSGDDPTTGDVLKPLQPLKAKVLIPCGIDLSAMLDVNRKFDGHFSYPTLFTGTYKNLGGQSSGSTGPSIDQAVSDAIAKQVNLPVPLLNLAAGTSRGTSFRSDSQRNTPETDPLRLHGRLFAGKNLSTDQVDALRSRRKSVLDFLGKDLSAYSARLGTEDRVKIAAHNESLREVETQLSAKSQGGCEAASAPSAGGDYATKVALFCKLTALAMRCDLTRVASMAWGDDGGSGPQSFPHIGVTEDYHLLAHKGPAGYGTKIKVDTWLYQQVFNLAKLLDDTMEAGGTALDHSVIVAASDMNEGNIHGVYGVPVVIVGSGGGYLKTGRAVRLGSWAGKTGDYWKSGSGVANNKLLATLGNAMDVPMDKFGGSAHGGVLPELTNK